MRRLVYFFLSTSLLIAACQKKETESATESPAEAASSEDQTAKDTPKVQDPVVKAEPIVTCESLGIPSYDGLIRELSSIRCESCHNDKLAFNGIKFLTYEDFVTYKVQAKVRIETNNLTKPLDPIEQGYFLDWFNNGLPKTEKDCQNKG